MKAKRNTIPAHLSTKKKKKAFSISSKALADAVASYKADGGEITQIKLFSENKADKQDLKGK